ncbi:unnamed protein product [Polarella glacialis]|uniref:Uncharacterized protein n=1 Tax=Polarella glacialis TaxID=89957 RepID=A0A813H389_POLGL|nr:unnamed protein product [Polarella glacialis]
MEFYRNRTVYYKASIVECWANTGNAPIHTKWLDNNKGDKRNREVRSRFVEKEHNRYKDIEFFAATPPIEALRFLILEAATARKRRKTQTAFINARRAYFNAESTKLTYIKLFLEDDELRMCGRLNQCMYGTRDTAKRW